MGKLIRITLPITSRTVSRVERFVDRVLEKAKAENARPVLIFEFQVPEDQEEFASGSEFTAALRLARLLASRRLVSEQTVAYVPQSLPGHALLVALACREIMMPGNAELGPVDLKPQEIGNTERSAYHEVAGYRKTIPAEVAMWMLDPSREVLKVETEIGREYVTREGLEELRKRRTIISEQPLREWIEGDEGQPGRFSGDQARRLGFVSYKPSGREDVAKKLELPREAMNEDPSLVEEWRAVQVKLEGRIEHGMVSQTTRLIEDQIRLREANFICVWIDSPGGSLSDSMYMANFLAGLDPNRIRTVAYIPRQARYDAALIALACDEVVMHAEADLGGSGDYGFSADDIEYAKDAIFDEDGPWKKRPQSLIAAMIDPDLEVFRCERQTDGEKRYLRADEYRRLNQGKPDAEQWKPGKPVTDEDELLVNGEEAVAYRLASLTAESLEEVKQHYGLDELALLEPGWANVLIRALAKPGLSFLLLAIAFVALYAELHAPGVGIGGFVATVCFLLFFWSHYLEGDAGWLEVLLFVAGAGCLLLEIFVLPGFGIFGLGGGCLVLASLILASQTSVLPRDVGELQRSLLPVVAAMVVVVAAAVLLRGWLPRAPILGQILLEPPAGEQAEDISRRESLVNLDDFVGKKGITTTQLTPSGKARFGDMLVDVITDGDVIQRGTQIEVVEVHGNRIIVKAVDGA